VHWSFAGGRVVEESTAPARELRITVRGRASGTKDLAELDGVHEVVQRSDGWVTVTAAQVGSDDLLRLPLADPAVHVEEVR
jgi:hypothetical protein